MKCTKCGNEVKKGVFCSNCGNKLFQDQVIDLETNIHKNNFTKFSYSRKKVIAQCMLAVICGIYFIFMVILCMFIDFDVRIRISKWRYIAFPDYLKGVYSFLAVVFLICVVVSVIRCVVFRKICICVYSDKVTGVSAKNLFYATECFDIKYTDIINVRQKGNIITIETGTKIYKCAVQDAQTAYEMIITAKNL